MFDSYSPCTQPQPYGSHRHSPLLRVHHVQGLPIEGSSQHQINLATMVFSSLVLLVLVSTIGRHKKLLPAALARGLCKSVIYQSTTVDGLPLAAATRSEENMFKTVC